MSAVAKLRAEAFTLSQEERLALADDLVASVHANPDPAWEAAWLDECDRRMESDDSGKTKTVSWADVKAEIDARLGSR